MSELQYQFIALLKEECKDKPYRQVALKAGITGRAISYWLTGKRVPRDLEVIEMVLGSLGKRLVIEDVESE